MLDLGLEREPTVLVNGLAPFYLPSRIPSKTLLEPCLRVLLAHPVGEADAALAALPPRDTGAGAAHDDVEVHAENTDSWVVLDTKVNVFCDAEAEVAGLGEVALAELVLLDLQAALEDLLSLWPTDGDVAGDLLVPSDAEGSDGVAGL